MSEGDLHKNKKKIERGEENEVIDRIKERMRRNDLFEWIDFHLNLNNAWSY